MDDNTFRMTYSNPAFGVFPTKFTTSNGSVQSVEIKASDFVGYDPYIFRKEVR